MVQLKKIISTPVAFQSNSTSSLFFTQKIQPLIEQNKLPRFLTEYAKSSFQEIARDLTKIKHVEFSAPLGGEDGYINKFALSFLKISRKLLFKDDVFAIHWKSRRDDLFKFFRVAIENTVYPPLLLLEKSISDANAKERFIAKKEAMLDIVTQTCLLIIAADDVADVGRKYIPSKTFCNIPNDVGIRAIPIITEKNIFCFDAQRCLAIALADRYEQELREFQDLYELTVESWVNALGRLKGLLVIDGDKAIQHIVKHFKVLMDSNLACLKVNKGEHNLSEINKVFEQVKLVECFESIEYVFTKSALVEFDAYIPQPIKDLLSNSEFVSHVSRFVSETNSIFNEFNAYATLERKLECGDITNNILGLVDQAVTTKLQAMNMSFFEYTYQLISGRAEFEEFVLPNIETLEKDTMGSVSIFSYRKPESFVDLLILLQKTTIDLCKLHYTFNELVPKDGNLTYTEYLSELETSFKNKDLYSTLSGRYLSYETKKNELEHLKLQLSLVIDAICQDVDSIVLINDVLNSKYQSVQEAGNHLSSFRLEKKDENDKKDNIFLSIMYAEMSDLFRHNINEFLKLFWMYMLAKGSEKGSY